MRTGEERRSQPRAGLECPAVAYLADQRVDCRALDISSTGIALWSPVAREPGQFLRVNFALSPPGGIPRWYDADGIVVRATPGRTGVVLGVQFVVIEDRVARDVHGYVLEALRRDTVAAGAGARAMPDAMNPPARTGEFFPAGAEPAAPARRRTAEYGATGTSDGSPSSAPRPHPEAAAKASSADRRAPVVPRTTVKPVAHTAPPDDASRGQVASRKEIDRLIQEAVSEVEGQRVGGRRDRRGK